MVNKFDSMYAISKVICRLDTLETNVVNYTNNLATIIESCEKITSTSLKEHEADLSKYISQVDVYINTVKNSIAQIEDISSYINYILNEYKIRLISQIKATLSKCENTNICDFIHIEDVLRKMKSISKTTNIDDQTISDIISTIVDIEYAYDVFVYNKNDISIDDYKRIGRLFENIKNDYTNSMKSIFNSFNVVWVPRISKDMNKALSDIVKGTDNLNKYVFNLMFTFSKSISGLNDELKNIDKTMYQSVQNSKDNKSNIIDQSISSSIEGLKHLESMKCFRDVKNTSQITSEIEGMINDLYSGSVQINILNYNQLFNTYNDVNGQKSLRLYIRELIKSITEVESNYNVQLDYKSVLSSLDKIYTTIKNKSENENIENRIHDVLSCIQDITNAVDILSRYLKSISNLYSSISSNIDNISQINSNITFDEYISLSGILKMETSDVVSSSKLKLGKLVKSIMKS